MEKCMRCIDVCGSLSEIMNPVPVESSLAKTLVGLPLTSYEGETIGRIISVDEINNKWYGRLATNADEQEIVLARYEQMLQSPKHVSMEICSDKGTDA